MAITQQESEPSHEAKSLSTDLSDDSAFTRLSREPCEAAVQASQSIPARKRVRYRALVERQINLVPE